MDSKQFGRRLFFIFPSYPFCPMHFKRKLYPGPSNKSRRKNPESPDAWEVRITSRPWAFISGGRQLEWALSVGPGGILLFIRLLWSRPCVGHQFTHWYMDWIIYTYHSIVNEYWRSLAKEGHEYAKVLWIQIRIHDLVKAQYVDKSLEFLQMLRCLPLLFRIYNSQGLRFSQRGFMQRTYVTTYSKKLYIWHVAGNWRHQSVKSSD